MTRHRKTRKSQLIHDIRLMLHLRRPDVLDDTWEVQWARLDEGSLVAASRVIDKLTREDTDD